MEKLNLSLPVGIKDARAIISASDISSLHPINNSSSLNLIFTAISGQASILRKILLARRLRIILEISKKKRVKTINSLKWVLDSDAMLNRGQEFPCRLVCSFFPDSEVIFCFPPWFSLITFSIRSIDFMAVKACRFYLALKPLLLNVFFFKKKSKLCPEGKLTPCNAPKCHYK